jgi:outer membrane protein assembly factor BamB
VELIGPYDINRRQFLWFIPYYDIAASWYSFPAVKGDMVYFGTADGYDGMRLGFFAYNRRNGKQVWEQRLDAEWGSGNGAPFAWDDEAVWYLYMRDVEMLDFMAPTVWKDLVIFTGGDSCVRAFDARTGALRWEKVFDMPVCSAPTIASGRVYFGLLGDETIPPQFVCISARDGKHLWQMETEGSLLSAPVIAGRRIIFGTDKSVFYVLEKVL